MVFRCLALLVLLITESALAANPLAYASGSWYNPERSGEGFVVQMLPDSRAVVTWFTYPPEGETGDQAWIIGSGTVAGSRIMITEMYRPNGATFGPEFDPETVEREFWGSLEIEFDDCNTATASWIGLPEFGTGSEDLVRITSIDDVYCDAETVPEPDRVISGFSGAWADPSHDGEGWMLEMLPDGRMVVYWFTYDDQGRQMWLTGLAEVKGKTLWVESMLLPRGARFGEAFRSEDVVREHWGSFGFHFEDCDNATMSYQSTDARFGKGSLQPGNLAPLADTDCDEPAPVKALTSGSWRLSTNVDVAMSESASATLDGFVYTGGGFGHLSRFQRFDPASGSYVEMPELPDSRHHAMMTSDGQSIFMAGGYTGNIGFSNPNNNFWKFDPQTNQWEILTNLPKARAAGAAVYLNGRIWLLGGEGPGRETQAYDINTGEWELFPNEIGKLYDHMQAVAFENEIWWMGGRSESNTSNGVVIFNPVSGQWREGPAMLFRRSGFAAKVVQGQIMVVGGEAVSGISFSLVESAEVFAPGAEGWVNSLNSPMSVHGTTGAVVNGQFILTAGSTIAGANSSNSATQIFTPTIP